MGGTDVYIEASQPLHVGVQGAHLERASEELVGDKAAGLGGNKKTKASFGKRERTPCAGGSFILN